MATVVRIGKSIVHPTRNVPPCVMVPYTAPRLSEQGWQDRYFRFEPIPNNSRFDAGHYTRREAAKLVSLPNDLD